MPDPLFFCAPEPHTPAEYRAVAQRLLKPEKTMPGYDEGWNDALYSLLDILGCEGCGHPYRPEEHVYGVSKCCPDCTHLDGDEAR